MALTTRCRVDFIPSVARILTWSSFMTDPTRTDSRKSFPAGVKLPFSNSSGNSFWLINPPSVRYFAIAVLPPSLWYRSDSLSYPSSSLDISPITRVLSLLLTTIARSVGVLLFVSRWLNKAKVSVFRGRSLLISTYNRGFLNCAICSGVKPIFLAFSARASRYLVSVPLSAARIPDMVRLLPDMTIPFLTKIGWSIALES